MKKGQEYIGLVSKIVFPNKGIVEYEEERDGTKVIIPVVIKGALPGQKIRFVLSKKRSSKCEGRILEVLEKSELENQMPVCEKFGICGGCTYQTMSYKNQLKLKEKMVKDILDKVIIDNYDFEGIIASPTEFAYRNKMEFSFGDECKGGELALGLHKKGSFYDIVTTDSCKIVNNDYNKILSTILDYCKKNNLPYYHKMSKEGFLRHLLVRRAVKTGDVTVSIVTTTLINWDFSDLVNELLTLELEGKITGVMHIFNDGLADMVRSDRTEVLYGSEFFYEEILGLKFKISTFSFFQTNSLGAEKLYEKAREYVGETKDKLIFDLYSGTGTIAQMLAEVAKKVIGVEIVEEAVEAAKENAKLNGLTNCEFIAGDVLKVIDEIEDKPDLIVLDPPRDGIHPKALDKIINYDVDRIVYISCKPTSLARDLEVMLAKGYKVDKACAVDMFPGTYHVETVVLIQRTNG
ncbi:MAG: 23S rRNA (uracil(1939)-C(5))-methyltransferase RlmD [Lachnospiraceae bacterium]|nr:23S rRNA (uracil(1939)-C(5))-methyltransferase RlmD [Lachnospiraceae bacterium]